MDTTIADLVADLRAATPSNAAELAVPDSQALLERAESLARQLDRHVRNRIELTVEKVQQLQRRLAPRRLLSVLATQSQRLDELQLRLAQSVRRRHSAESVRLQQRQELLRQRLLLNLQQRQTRVGHLRRILDAVNPQQVLERGYALVEQTESGRLIQDKRQIGTGEKITVTLKRGRLFARVEAKGD